LRFVAGGDFSKVRFAMPAHRTATLLLALTTVTVPPFSTAHAAGDPTGVWINDTGRGAIEIKSCGASLCGHVVWVKDTNDTKGCGRQIIGNAAKVNSNTWDNGWIYSPEKKQKYDVELKPLSNGTLQVTGYAGTKLFSKTMIWKRAPSSLVRCGAQETIAKADPAAKPGSNPKAETKAKQEPKPAAKAVAVAKPEPAIVPPTPKPAERPAAKSDVVTPTAEPVEIARAEPEAASPSATKGSDVASTEAETKPVPQVHALPGVDNEQDAPAVAAPRDDENEPSKKLDMGQVAKKLAQIERETGYGLKKTGNGNCRLKVPYATVNFPCKD
jgi:uncharacterized protein (DUF2147 family)